MEKISVLVADDKEFMRQALVRILETQEKIQVIGVAVDGQDAVDQVSALRPQVAILDIRMPRMNGIEAAHRIIDKNPGTGIVIVSSHDETEYIVDLLRGGPDGKAYLLKQSIDDIEELTHAIESVVKGLTVLDPAIARKLAGEYSLGRLTDTEQWALALLAEGYSDFAIMKTTHVDWETMAEIMHSLFQKLNLPPEDTNQRNLQAVLALVDPQDELRRTWLVGYKG